MALNGRAGQRFSQAPQPMQRSSSTTGMSRDEGSSGTAFTIVMAPVGQWRAQLSHCTSSRSVTQFSRIQTAWPICVADFSARVMGRMAPVGQTDEHSVHSGRQ